MTMKKLISTLCFLAIAIVAVAQTQVISHRGYWNHAGSAKNSLKAYVLADSIGSYGSEFDVWITADDHIVVNHDNSYKGKKIEESTLAELQGLHLDNGEPMPSMRQFFEIAKRQTSGMHLILELKSHSTKARETHAVERIVKLVKEYGLEDRMEYISFSLHGCKEFIRLAPKGTPVFYLNGELSPAQLKEMGFAGMDYHEGVILDHPEWVKEAHNLGMKVNVWTVNKAETMRKLIDLNVDYITTDEPELLQSVLKEN